MRILYLEPFDGGSHAAFGAALARHVAAEWTVLTLPGRHWKWRMRGSALWFVERHAAALAEPHDVLLCSSYLPLADLLALAPHLARLPKVVWFHENQWAYPVREERERDRHFGFTQLVSAAAADLCLFNSEFNRSSFLAGCERAIRAMPDARPQRGVAALEERCEVFPMPVELPGVTAEQLVDVPAGEPRQRGPCILWNHRWEHDKDPETFFRALDELARRRRPFRVVVAGQRYATLPEVFEVARARLGARVVHFGFEPERARYVDLLLGAQIAVSTARHEFFGTAVLEAVHCGACPLVPDALAYPEIVPARHRYRDFDDLVDTLDALCALWTAGERALREDRRSLTAAYDARAAGPRLLERLAAVQPR